MDDIIYSDYNRVLDNARKRGYNPSHLFFSNRPQKKYMIWNPYTSSYVHFGQAGQKDFTAGDVPAYRRANYLIRSDNIHGQWRMDDYSPNNLSRRLLWESDD